MPLNPVHQKTTLCTSEAHRVTWWMAHYGGPTPKRHVAYSNSHAIGLLDLGRLKGWSQKQKAKKKAGLETVTTVVKYIDKQGRQRYKGSKALKFSESETHLWETKAGNTVDICFTNPVSAHDRPSLAFGPGTIRWSLVANSYPSSRSWSQPSPGCLSCRKPFHRQKKCLNKWFLMTNGKMQKCNPYVIIYGVPKNWLSLKVSGRFFPGLCEALFSWYPTKLKVLVACYRSTLEKTTSK